MIIAFGSDHAGFRLKEYLVATAKSLGHTVEDMGTYNQERTDYPLFAFKVAEAVVSGACERGVLVCGTGLGMSIAANKVAGVRAALCSECYSAHMSREHNDANILCIGERVVGYGLAEDILKTFLETDFSKGESHIRRLRQIEKRELR